MSNTKKRLLSGLQPSGELTIGNYCGGIKQFLQYQEQYDSFLFFFFLHTITVPQGDPLKVKERTRNLCTENMLC